MDEFLPRAILDASQVLLIVIGAITLTCIVNPIFILPIIGIGLLGNQIKKFYLKTSKNVKRLEGISKYQIEASTIVSKLP